MSLVKPFMYCALLCAIGTTSPLYAMQKAAPYRTAKGRGSDTKVKRRMTRKPPFQKGKISAASFISEVATLYGLIPLPYHWQALSSSYPPTGKYNPHSLIEMIAQQAAAREEVVPEQVEATKKRYTALLESHLEQYKAPIDSSGEVSWIEEVCTNLLKQKQANLTDKRAAYAPSAPHNNAFDPSRYIAHVALMETDLYRSAHNNMQPFAEKETTITWRHKGETLCGTRIPLRNINKSCVPYSLIIGAHQCVPAEIKDLDVTVSGLRNTVAQYIQSNLWSQYISSFFSSTMEALDHCEHLKSNSDYGAHGSAFQQVDIQTAAVLMQANIFVVRAVPPCDKDEYSEIIAKGALKAVPHFEFLHPDQSQVKQSIYLLFTHHERGNFYSPIMSHCEPIIGVKAIDRPAVAPEPEFLA